MKAIDVVKEICGESDRYWSIAGAYCIANADARRILMTYGHTDNVLAIIKNEIGALMLIQGSVKPYIIYCNKYSQGGCYDYTAGRIYENSRWRNGKLLEAYALLKEKGKIVDAPGFKKAEKYFSKWLEKEEKRLLMERLKTKIEAKANGETR